MHEIEHLLWISNAFSKYLTCEFKVVLAKQFSHRITAHTELISYFWNSLDKRGMQFHTYVTGILLWSVSISNCKNIQTSYMTRLLLFQKVESNGGPFFKVILECKKGVLNLFLSIHLAYNVISCRKVEKTQMKIAKFSI